MGDVTIIDTASIEVGKYDVVHIVSRFIFRHISRAFACYVCIGHIGRRA